MFAAKLAGDRWLPYIFTGFVRLRRMRQVDDIHPAISFQQHHETKNGPVSPETEPFLYSTEEVG